MSAFICDNRHFDLLVYYGLLHSSEIHVYLSMEERERLTPSVRLQLRPMHGDGPNGDPGWFVWPLDEAQATGELLRAENVRSVTIRYPEDAPSNLPGAPDNTSWEFRRTPLDALQPAIIVRAADCLEYQSCESDDWEQTLAHKVLDAIRQYAYGKLVDAALQGRFAWEVTDQTLKELTDRPSRRIVRYTEGAGA